MFGGLGLFSLFFFFFLLFFLSVATVGSCSTVWNVRVPPRELD